MFNGISVWSIMDVPIPLSVWWWCLAVNLSWMSEMWRHNTTHLILKWGYYANVALIGESTCTAIISAHRYLPQRNVICLEKLEQYMMKQMYRNTPICGPCMPLMGADHVDMVVIQRSWHRISFYARVDLHIKWCKSAVQWIVEFW